MECLSFSKLASLPHLSGTSALTFSIGSEACLARIVSLEITIIFKNANPETALFLNEYIDIPLTMRKRAKAMKPTKQQVSAGFVLFVSILCLIPALAYADQPQLTPIAINATGQATAIGTGLSGAATLNLKALDYKNSNQWLIIQNVTGSLSIGSTNFQVTDGHGSVSIVGAMAIFADTAAGKGQLILQGTMKGNSVTFQMPSQLASTSYLSLTGTLASTSQQTLATPNTITNSTQITTTSTTSHTNTAQQIKVTSTSSMIENTTTGAVNTSIAAATTLETSNTTEKLETSTTSVGSITLPTPSNGIGQHNVVIHVVEGQGEICVASQYLLPLCTNSTQSVTVRDGDLVNFDSDAGRGFTWDHYDGLGAGESQNFNANVTQDGSVGVYFAITSAGAANVTAAIVTAPSTIFTIPSTTVIVAVPTSNVTIPAPANVTATQSLNQPSFVTQTAANYTVTYTVTSTVANTTITQANTTVTITVNATTTVSNTT